jgi:hypothetical protein
MFLSLVVHHTDNDESEFRSTALEATERLKKTVMNERESSQRLQDLATQLEAKVEELEEQLSRSRKAEDDNRASARQLEEALAQQERLRLQQQAQEVR